MINVAKTKPTLLTTRAAAAMTPFTPGYFNKARMKGEGPAYVQIGNRVFYDEDVILAWLDGHRVDPAGAVRREPAEDDGDHSDPAVMQLADS